MHEADADQTAERPEPSAKVGGGTAKVRGSARQACTGPTECAGTRTQELLQKVVSRENLLLAHRRVVQNGGAPGVDGMTTEALLPYCRQHWPAIREQLLQGTYEPSAVRKVEIPKPAGGMRTLGIPTVLDRLIQQAISQVLTPIFDPTFSDGSFGFRPGRSTHQAVLRARQQDPLCGCPRRGIDGWWTWTWRSSSTASITTCCWHGCDDGSRTAGCWA